MIWKEKYHGFHVHDHDDTISRMSLNCMVPLEFEQYDSPQPAPVPPLDQTHECVQTLLSKYTLNINAWLSWDTKHVKHEELLPIEYNHQSSKTEANQDNFYIGLNRDIKPEPASYDVNFAPVEPDPKITTLPPTNNLVHYDKEEYWKSKSKSKSKEEENIELLTAAEVCDLYNNDIRKYNSDKVYIKERDELNLEQYFRMKPEGIYLSNTSRDDSIFKMTTPASHIPPYDPPRAEPPVVPDIKKMKGHTFYRKKDSQRDYPKAVEQADKLRPKKPFHRFSTDTPREKSPTNNHRISNLERFKKEKNELIKDFSKFSTKDKKSTEISKSRNETKPQSSFDKQTPRSNKMYPNEKNQANEREQIYPCDPLESFKNTQPRVRVVTIRPTPKPLSDTQFWKTTWIGT